MINYIPETEKKVEIVRKKNQIGPVWDLLVEELRKVWGDKNNMINFCLSEIDILKQFPNGEIFTVKKERIEKSFCFGFGFCGVSTSEDEKEAYKMANKAQNDINYFLEKNLRHLNNLIADIEKGEELYSMPHYYESEKYRKIAAPYKQDLEILKKCRLISDEEKEIYLSALKEEREKSKKRLTSYLKKYGLSKVRAWAFLSD